jgi:hypothetical protein
MKKTTEFILQPTVLLTIFIFAYGQAMAITCIELDGAYVYSQESSPVYLGFFGNQFAFESIMNKYGTYGSPYNRLSVRNNYGTYGSPYSSYSANNEYTSTPPKVYKNGSLIAYLTNNTFITGGVPLAAIDASCTFYSASPSPGNPPPSPPSWVNASDGTYTDKIQLVWTTVADATEYNVYYAESLTGTKNLVNSTIGTVMNIIGATPDKLYYFWISSTNSYGEGIYSNPDSGYMASQPASSGSNLLLLTLPAILNSAK